jgi:hypothetical protein
LEVPQTLKDSYLKSISEFESGLVASAISVDHSIEVMEKKLKESLDQWLQLSRDRWRSEGRNRAFCDLLKGDLGLSGTSLFVMMRADSQADTYGVREAFAHISSAKAKAELGYKLCGFSPDSTYQKVMGYFTEAQFINQRQDPEKNRSKACAHRLVQKWPSLRERCLSSETSQEFLHTIHNALNNQFQEEK